MEGASNTLPKTFDFGTMYTSIPHQQLKDSIKAVIIEAYEYQADKMNTTTTQLAIAPELDDTPKWVTKGGTTTKTCTT